MEGAARAGIGVYIGLSKSKRPHEHSAARGLSPLAELSSFGLESAGPTEAAVNRSCVELVHYFGEVVIQILVCRV